MRARFDPVYWTLAVGQLPAGREAGGRSCAVNRDAGKPRRRASAPPSSDHASRRREPRARERSACTDGQSDREGGAFAAAAAADAECALVKFDDASRDVEAETESGCIIVLL